ncbi:uncharacterized protein LOC106777153 isoform X1 [Vigna radiata var. radiata]|uniref:Uncharacterized protein LOC106777153 isoform X1 n=1 Tax=Vigna radiata var. radiata TaxID=3916 RepID=A0A1S3VP55_VIGRR|nr:uncharacterized protein LOC106777153 isoform X1 [Vigna radiata var. radiata]XP_014520166.1 uncharacterized protein LOC106777153 isoform X1 [Vigna radiata var. radiata]XP_022631441.1 uncharacterized protein LOC106777153 isoform X1 [Vigna radiata var. radiata]XP_022631442.1 uncharacterized protein LOC106777153 isoform X1 [Vigna radiata var. radiata]XP_022631443.1 uncharacterized protein LOC106777153 isoform X1 [Vigna radiata var. radiata]
MALILELLTNIILLVTKPFSLLNLAFWFGIKIALTVIYTWTELIRTTISFYVNIVLSVITWTCALISLPARAVNVFQKERELEQKLQEMQIELENLVREKKELEEHFQMVVKERRMVEILLAEIEEEHDMAIAKIEKLEGKLRDQRNENLRLKEIRGKGSRDQNKSEKFKKISLQDLLTSKDMGEDESKTRSELLKLLKTGSKSGSVNSEMISKDVETMETVTLDHHRDIALSQSLFTALMSLVVGVTVWEAEDPCMPLVVALFAVVGMSLKSVVKFFSSIRNKPASDVVALLSFNLFILGTLSYPTLPKVVRMLV